MNSVVIGSADAAATATAAAEAAAAAKATAGTTISVNADGTKATVQRDADAVAAAEAAAKKAAEDAKNRPAWLDAKFKTPEELAAAYTELQKKLGEKATEKKTEAPTGTPAEIALKAGLDLQALNNEYAANGALTDATMAKLAEKGITPAMVDSYIEGMKAQVAQDRNELLTVLNGNEEDLATLYKWAETNLSKEEIKGYNALVTGPNRNIPAAKVYLDAMVGRYNAALGKDPTTVVSGAGVQSVAAGVQPFGDRSEIVAAMRDPRYEKSPAYRAQVEARIAVTPF
jgi:hypothetical protein